MEKKSIVDIRDLAYPDENLKIKQAMSYINMQQPETINSVIKGKANLNRFREHVTEVSLDDHGVGRWNERIGPHATLHILKHIFTSIVFLQPYRIEVLENQLALLDDEIAFAYEIRGTQMMITTFFGRVSVNPSLGNVDILRRYNKHFNEQIQLEIPKEKLVVFDFPIAPKSSIEFSITSNEYKMYFYQNNQDQNMYYLISYLNLDTKKWEHTLIDLQHVNRTKVNETELYILAMLGHAEFVYNYLKLYEKERFQNLYNIYSKRAIHKYVGFKYKR